MPFVDRRGLLTGLNQWMGSDQPFAGYLLGGRGGAGKTKLGVELCRLAGQNDWLCGMPSHTTDKAQLETLADTPTARLLIVDYAETRTEHLEMALPVLAASATSEHPVRVLLLVRSAPHRTDDWTEPLRGRGDLLDAVLDDLAVHLLDQDPPMRTSGPNCSPAAARAFAAHLDRPDSPVPGPPVALRGPTFASPLLVSIAAYLAVHDPDRTVPISRDDLLTELVRHEDRYWRATSSAQHLGLDDADLRGRVIALATLAGADTEQEAAALLRLLPDLTDAPAERLHTLARWIRNLYPGPRWWNALEPDLLGEHMVAEHLADQPDVLDGVLRREDPAALVTVLDLYARAAPDHAALADVVGRILSTRLDDLCTAAIHQVSSTHRWDLLHAPTIVATAVGRAVAALPVERDVLEAVADRLTPYTNVILGPLALSINEQLVAQYRRLADVHPDTYEPTLVGWLNDLSVRLIEAGRREEALIAIEEAVQICTRLDSAEPGSYELDLAVSLTNLSNRLAETDHAWQAMTFITRAVEIYSRLALADPGTHAAGLAASLNSLSSQLADAGRHEEALTVIRQVVKIRRRLVEADRDSHTQPRSVA